MNTGSTIGFRLAIALACLAARGTCAATDTDGLLDLSTTSVQIAEYIKIGGIDQWITIRGANRANPVLLILHGGPGDVFSPFASTFVPLEHSFTIVQWDQRGAGKTLAREGTSQNTSIEQLIADGIELTEYVKETLHTDRVILLGHSWGSYLGIRLVKTKPKLYLAFVGSGQLVSWKLSMQALYQLMLTKTRVQTLSAQDIQWMRGASPAATPEEFAAYSAISQASLQNSSKFLDPAMLASNLPALGFRFPIPYVLIQGQDDLLTPTSVAVDYFGKVKAPHKRLTLIKGAGHMAIVTHMKEFAQALEEGLKSVGVTM